MSILPPEGRSAVGKTAARAGGGQFSAGRFSAGGGGGRRKRCKSWDAVRAAFRSWEMQGLFLLAGKGRAPLFHPRRGGRNVPGGGPPARGRHLEGDPLRSAQPFWRHASRAAEACPASFTKKLRAAARKCVKFFTFTALDGRLQIWYNDNYVKLNALQPSNLRRKGGEKMAKNLEISYLLDFYGRVLTEKQRDVMEQYYNDDLSLAEIAANFGISRQGVRDAIKRGEAILLDLEDKVGFAGRYREVQRDVARIEELARDIRFENEEGYAP